MEKGLRVDQRSGLVTIFESLVDMRVLLDCIRWHRTEEHGEPRLLSIMSFRSLTITPPCTCLISGNTIVLPLWSESANYQGSQESGTPGKVRELNLRSVEA